MVTQGRTATSNIKEQSSFAFLTQFQNVLVSGHFGYLEPYKCMNKYMRNDLRPGRTIAIPCEVEETDTMVGGHLKNKLGQNKCYGSEHTQHRLVLEHLECVL